MTSPVLPALIRAFETLTPESVADLLGYYATDASFKDPFNEVRGIEAITRIFRHMFVQVEEPRFVIGSQFHGEDGTMLLWDFHFRTRGLGARTLCVRGTTHLRFDPEGRVAFHRDYWDSTEELYAKLPLIGGLMRSLRRMGRA